MSFQVIVYFSYSFKNSSTKALILPSLMPDTNCLNWCKIDVKMQPLVWMGRSDLLRFSNLFWTNCTEDSENLEGTSLQHFKFSNSIKCLFTHYSSHQAHNYITDIWWCLPFFCHSKVCERLSTLWWAYCKPSLYCKGNTVTVWLTTVLPIARISLTLDSKSTMKEKKNALLAERQNQYCLKIPSDKRSITVIKK